jgi:hypothetical protein
MKADYWDVSDDQVIEKTGNSISHWMSVLKKFKNPGQKSNDYVSFLQKEHQVPRYWDRTLTTRYLKTAE